MVVPQAVTAQIDARPGGLFRMIVRGDGFASGRFTAIEPYRRMFEITLEPDGDDGTRLTLIHTGLPWAAIDSYRRGWDPYLDRLAIRAGGGDPGPDPSSMATPARCSIYRP